MVFLPEVAGEGDEQDGRKGPGANHDHQPQRDGLTGGEASGGQRHAFGAQLWLVPHKESFLEQVTEGQTFQQTSQEIKQPRCSEFNQIIKTQETNYMYVKFCDQDDTRVRKRYLNAALARPFYFVIVILAAAWTGGGALPQEVKCTSVTGSRQAGASPQKKTENADRVIVLF